MGWMDLRSTDEIVLEFICFEEATFFLFKVTSVRDAACQSKGLIRTAEIEACRVTLNRDPYPCYRHIVPEANISPNWSQPV